MTAGSSHRMSVDSDVETVHFALDDHIYEIELDTTKARELREVFAPFIAKGRQAKIENTGEASGRAATLCRRWRRMRHDGVQPG